MAEPVTVTLTGGPCADQELQVHPVRSGYMPRSLMACRPQPADGIGDIDYFTYYRVGPTDSTTYMYWRNVVAWEERR